MIFVIWVGFGLVKEFLDCVIVVKGVIFKVKLWLGIGDVFGMLLLSILDVLNEIRVFKIKVIGKLMC